jgi:hypothetical protein
MSQFRTGIKIVAHKVFWVAIDLIVVVAIIFIVDNLHNLGWGLSVAGQALGKFSHFIKNLPSFAFWFKECESGLSFVDWSIGPAITSCILCCWGRYLVSFLGAFTYPLGR